MVEDGIVIFDDRRSWFALRRVGDPRRPVSGDCVSQVLQLAVQLVEMVQVVEQSFDCAVLVGFPVHLDGVVPASLHGCMQGRYFELAGGVLVACAIVVAQRHGHGGAEHWQYCLQWV